MTMKMSRSQRKPRGLPVSDFYLVGIDPGVKTGMAIMRAGSYVTVGSDPAVRVEQFILECVPRERSVIVIEDARLRTWFGNFRNSKQDRDKLQGAGSVKRDCQRWEEFCRHHGYQFRLQHPAKNKTKTTAEAFRQLTGWPVRTNEHARDAAMLIWPLRRMKID